MQLINVRHFINYKLVKMIVECVWYHANALKYYKTASKHNIYIYILYISVNMKWEHIVCVYKNEYKGQLGES